MNKLIQQAASGALALAGDTASRMKNGVSRVPAALKTIGTGAAIVGLRDGSRKVARVVQRNPVTTAAAVTVAVGAGVALWLLQRNKQRRAVDEKMRPIEVEAVRVERKPVARRAPRKPAARRGAATSTAST